MEPNIVYITAKQMSRVDKVAMKKYDIDILEMMENAGSNLAVFVGKLRPKKVLVLYDKGNNGGGGLVAARHLAIQGIHVSILGAEKNGNKNVKHHLKILKEMKIRSLKKFPDLKREDVIIDALLGYNIKGNPKGKYKELINVANEFKAKGVKIVSLDLPSGINPDSGKKGKPTVNANYIVTLALPKKGLKKLKNVYLANIGIPNEVYVDVGIKVGRIFKGKNFVKI